MILDFTHQVLYFGPILFVIVGVLIFWPDEAESEYWADKPTLTEVLIKFGKQIDTVGKGPAYFILIRIWNNVHLILEKDPKDTLNSHTLLRREVQLLTESVE